MILRLLQQTTWMGWISGFSAACVQKRRIRTNRKNRCCLCLTGELRYVWSHDNVSLFQFCHHLQIQHLVDHHYSQASFTLAKQDELDEEVITAENDNRDKDPIWRCIHCYGTNLDDQSPMTVERITRHFSGGIHQGISSPIRHRDYYEDFAAPNIHTKSYRHHMLYVRCLNNGQFKLVNNFTDLPSTGMDDSESEGYYGDFY